jgi:2'-5' RNA ligase
MSAPDGATTATTIGVSIALPEPSAGELEDYRRRIGDPTADGVPSHITLVPPTHIAPADLPGIADHLEAAAARHAPFRVHLRGTATFRPVSPVVFIALTEGISQCEQLADSVRRGPLAVELDFPYHPHVTIAHHLDDAALDRAFEELADFDFAFEVGEFHLYVHRPVRGWVPTRTFRLTRAPDTED